MIVDGVDDFFSRGIDFVALLGFGLLYLGLGIQLGTRFLSGSIPLSDLRNGRCAYCVLAERVNKLLAGRDGAVSTQLQPLVEAFAQVRLP